MHLLHRLYGVDAPDYYYYYYCYYYYNLLLLQYATPVSRESFPWVQHRLVWLGHEDGERRAASQLIRGDDDEVVVLTYVVWRSCSNVPRQQQ